MEAHTKERVIEAAREQFLAHGFSKVTMDELVQQIGISKKTMYQYFRSKDELMDAVMEWQVVHVGGKVNEIMKSSDDFITKLYQLWNFIGRMACSISSAFREDVRRFRPDLWKRVEDLRRELIIANFSRMIDEGISKNLVRKDVNKQAMVLMYLSSIQGVVNPETLSQNSFSMEEAFKTIMTVYLDGILTDEARKQFHSRISIQ